MAESITVTDLENAKLDAITIEEVATSQLDTSTDRKGNTKNTLQGALKTLGFKPPVAYAAAISFTISDNTKTVEEAGVIYAPLPSALPFTTTGTFIGGDDAKFFVVQGVTTDNISQYTNRNFSTVAALKADATVKVGNFVSVENYTATNNSGVLFFKIVAAATGVDDGGSYIDLPGSGLQAKQNFSTMIDITQFGAEQGYLTDSAPKFLAASTFISSSSDKGYTLTIAGKHLIDTSVTIPKNVSVMGVHNLTGNPGDNVTAPYDTLNSALQINPLATISLGSNSSISGLFLYRKSMTFPASSSSLFAGTAITVVGEDVGVFNSLIMGFDTAIVSSGHQRFRGRDLSIDCQNGINIENSLDICYLTRVHCWPFATIAEPAKPANWADRGVAFNLINVGDWTKLTDCFSYGYLNGYHLSSVNSCTLVSCSADGTATYAGSIGFNIESGCTDTRMLMCQSAAQYTGYRIDADLIANLPTQLIGCDSWGCIDHGKLVDGGDVRIDGGLDRDATNGVSINNASSKVFIDNNRLSDIGSLPINCIVPTTNVRLGNNIDYGTLAVGNSVVNNNKQTFPIATASTISIPPDVNSFKLTGSLQIQLVNSGWSGRRVTFRTDAAVAFVHGFGGGANPSAMVLQGAVDWAAPAGATLELEHDGGLWYEVSRRG